MGVWGKEGGGGRDPNPRRTPDSAVFRSIVCIRTPRESPRDNFHFSIARGELGGGTPRHTISLYGY